MCEFRSFTPESYKVILLSKMCGISREATKNSPIGIEENIPL